MAEKVVAQGAAVCRAGAFFAHLQPIPERAVQHGTMAPGPIAHVNQRELHPAALAQARVQQATLGALGLAAGDVAVTDQSADIFPIVVIR